MKTITLTEARKNLFQIRKNIIENHEEVLITHKNGNLIIMSQDDRENIMETFFILKDRKTMESLEKTISLRKAGKNPGGLPIEKAFPDLET